MLRAAFVELSSTHRAGRLPASRPATARRRFPRIVPPLLVDYDGLHHCWSNDCCVERGRLTLFSTAVSHAAAVVRLGWLITVEKGVRDRFRFLAYTMQTENAEAVPRLL